MSDDDRPIYVESTTGVGSGRQAAALTAGQALLLLYDNIVMRARWAMANDEQGDR